MAIFYDLQQGEGKASTSGSRCRLHFCRPAKAGSPMVPQHLRVHFAVQRAYRSLSGIKRPVRPASFEILQTFSNSADNNGLWCENNPPFSDLRLKDITNINASLLAKRVGKGYLKLCLDFDERHRFLKPL